MFNEKYGLQKAVLSRTKTKTRRDGKKVEKQYALYVVANEMNGKEDYLSLEEFAISKSPYKVGDIVAIAQSYRQLLAEEYLPSNIENEVIRMVEKNHIGCTNKMYVKAELMPHHVRITEVRFERLHDISEEDCLREGIVKTDCVAPYGFPVGNEKWKNYRTP